MNIKTLIISSIVLLSLDYIYLKGNAKYFHKVFENIQNSKMNIRIGGAILCYIALLILLNYFLLDDKNKTIKDAFLLGFLVYAIYDTTNYTTFDKWPIKLMIMDCIWGGILLAITFYLTNLIKKLKK